MEGSAADAAVGWRLSVLLRWDVAVAVGKLRTVVGIGFRFVALEFTHAGVLRILAHPVQPAVREVLHEVTHELGIIGVAALEAVASGPDAPNDGEQQFGARAGWR